MRKNACFQCKSMFLYKQNPLNHLNLYIFPLKSIKNTLNFLYHLQHNFTHKKNSKI